VREGHDPTTRGKNDVWVTHLKGGLSTSERLGLKKTIVLRAQGDDDNYFLDLLCTNNAVLIKLRELAMSLFS